MGRCGSGPWPNLGAASPVLISGLLLLAAVAEKDIWKSYKVLIMIML
jgi:hypothetical protein